MRVLHGLLGRLICSVSTLKWILQHAAVAMVFSSSLKFFSGKCRSCQEEQANGNAQKYERI